MSLRITSNQYTLTLCAAFALALALGGCNAKGPKAEQRFWIENAIVQHGYSPIEAADGLHMPLPDLLAKMKEYKIEPGATPPPAPVGHLRIAPWVAGRHPRLGFLDGAINPQRDTKISIFMPWNKGGYVVLDLPEAIFTNLGLTYLAHTHIPTIWNEEGVTLPPIDWTRGPNGELSAERTLPNRIKFGATATPTVDGLAYEYWIENGTNETLTGVRSQLCLMLGRAPFFAEQSATNKVEVENTAAAQSTDGKHWIVTACEGAKTWQNPPVPCIHADPLFPDLAPGARASVKGRVFVWEGVDVKTEIKLRRAKGLLFRAP